MKISKQTIITAVAVAIIVAGAFYVFLPNKKPVISANEAIATASFYDLQEKVQPLAQWKGKVLVVNFWATWCPPCLAEIPEFIHLQKQYEKQGVQFIGIAIDQKSKVQAYAKDALFLKVKE